MYDKKFFDRTNLHKHEAIVFLGQHREISTYICQYRLAVSILIEQIEKNRISPVDLISSPILFLIRHVFELFSKGLILAFEKEIDVGLPNLVLDNASHKVSLLKDYLIKYLIGLKEEALPEKFFEPLSEYHATIKNICPILEKIDNESYKTRYPFNTSLAANYDPLFQMNCIELFDLYFKYLELSDKVWQLTEIFSERNSEV